MYSRIAFVTGASRGIGRCCATALAADGHKVILASRDAARLDETAEAIRSAGGACHIIPIDIGSKESIEAAFSRAEAEVGHVEILVNNAGITRDNLAIRMPHEDWEEVLHTNLTGAFVCISQVMRPMMKARWGRIVNISSVVGEAGNPGQANYAASKAGLIGLTKSLALELGSRAITVNAVTPGFIETDMTAKLSEEVRHKVMDHIPLKRLGKPEDVAAAVRFLVSEEAGYITGHVLKVNGGMYL